MLWNVSVGAAIFFSAQIFFNQLYQWYISNFFLGICLGFIFTTPLNMILQNWFHSKLGLALGIAMSTSGLCGTLVNPLSSWMIVHFGWRSGIVLISLISLICILPTIIFVIKWDPESFGMNAYSSNEIEKVKDNKVIESDPKIVQIGFLIVIIMYAMSQYVNSISVFIYSIGLSITFAGLITSSLMLGNLLGKVIIGFLADILGTFRVMIVSVTLILLSLIAFVFVRQPVILMIAAFFYGLISSLVSLSCGLISKEILPLNQRASAIGKMNSYGTIAGALMYLLVSYSYDWFQGFTVSFIVCIILSCITIYLLVIIQKKRNNVN